MKAKCFGNQVKVPAFGFESLRAQNISQNLFLGKMFKKHEKVNKSRMNLKNEVNI